MKLLASTQYVIGCYSTKTIAFECSSLEAMEELRNFYAVAPGVVPHPSLCVYSRLEWLSGCTAELVTKLTDLLLNFVGEDHRTSILESILQSWNNDRMMIDLVASKQKAGIIAPGFYKQLRELQKEFPAIYDDLENDEQFQP